MPLKRRIIFYWIYSSWINCCRHILDSLFKYPYFVFGLYSEKNPKVITVKFISNLCNRHFLNKLLEKCILRMFLCFVYFLISMYLAIIKYARIENIIPKFSDILDMIHCLFLTVYFIQKAKLFFLSYYFFSLPASFFESR